MVVRSLPAERPHPQALTGKELLGWPCCHRRTASAGQASGLGATQQVGLLGLSLIHISEPTRLALI
eukprot:13568211-Alexandrium_andersonii.AAC.1